MLFTRKNIEKQFKINGLHCGGCVKRVENALGTFKEIKSVNISLEDGIAIISLKKELADSKIIETIEDLGFKATSL